MARDYNKFFQNTKTPFESTKLGIGVNTVLGLPKATLDVGKNIARETARSIASAGLSISGLFGAKQDKAVPEVKPEDFKSFLGQGIWETVFGKEPVKSLEQRIAENEIKLKNSPTVKSLGLDKSDIPLMLSFAGIVGDSSLSLTPLGGEKNAIKQLTKETSEKGILKILGKIGIEEDVAKTFSTKLANTKNVKETEDVFNTMKSYIGTKKLATQTTNKFPTIHEGGEIKMVNGEPVKIIDGIETFAHKGDGGWVVSESSTGRFLAESNTKEGAIAKAKFNINNVGEDKFRKLIEENKLSTSETSRLSSEAEGQIGKTVETQLPNSPTTLVSQPRNRNLYSPLKDNIPLIQEARKYKSAEEFVKAQGERVYHGTDSKSFKPSEFDIKKAQKGEVYFNPLGEGLYVSSNKDFVKRFGENIEEFIIPPSAKIKRISIDTWEKDFPSIAKKSLKNLGIKYDDLTLTEKIEINKLVPDSPIESANNFEVWLRDISERLNKEGSVQDAIQKAVMDKYKDYDVLKYLDTDYALGADEIVVKNPSILKTKSQLTDIWKKANKVDDLTKETLNLERLNIDETAKANLKKTIEDIKPELEDIRGGTLTNEEVLKAAEDSSILTKISSKEATKKSEAALLKTRQNLAALAEGKGISEDFIKQLKIVSAEATKRGRQLQALKIEADPTLSGAKSSIVKQLLDIGINVDDIVKASEKVDFNNPEQLTKFYRQFVKPKLSEYIDEYRYINLLSSPKTHIVNTFSNILQTGLRPATKLATGVVDFIGSTLTGKARKAYVSEVPAYAKGVVNSFGKAIKGFSEALLGKSIVERPDINRIPTGSKLFKPFQAIPRLLEGSDVFFRTLITEGEKNALALRYKKQGLDLTKQSVKNALEKEAKAVGEYGVFRKALDPSNKTGQGAVLSNIDKVTTAIYSLRKVPGVKWFVPFVQTPMNILKQGIEYSPAGLATLYKSTNKSEQLGKSLIGSMVFAGAGMLALDGRATWSAPTNEKEKNAFYNSGRQPYSLKIGDKWFGYSKLGPLAYPIAMAAATNWYLLENPKRATDDAVTRMVKSLGGISGFFADQSYLQGISDLISMVQGDVSLGVRSITGPAQQLIPLVSLQRWINQIIDPVYRRPDSKGSFSEKFFQDLEKNIIGLSQDVPKIKSSTPRQLPVLNAFSPIPITQTDKRSERQLELIRRQQETKSNIEARKKGRDYNKFF